MTNETDAVFGNKDSEAAQRDYPETGITALEYAAITLRVEHPSLPAWLNEMTHMARRDEFAKAAMQGLLANQTLLPKYLIHPEDVSRDAILHANAMIAEECER